MSVSNLAVNLAVNYRSHSVKLEATAILYDDL